MKLTGTIVALFAVSVVACAQDQQQKSRKLESVTWNSMKHQLTWVVTDGGKASQDGNFKPSDKQNYAIDMDNATMTYNGETRRFSPEEAKRVHVLMDLIAKYAVESTVWWDQGQGQRLQDGEEDDQPGTKIPRRAANNPQAEVLMALLQAFPAPPKAEAAKTAPSASGR